MSPSRPTFYLACKWWRFSHLIRPTPAIIMKRLLLTLFLMMLLGGCSSVRLIDSQVLAISTLPANSPPMTGVHYRFERLPSQTLHAGAAQAETLAQEALARVGLTRDDEAGNYSVLLGVGVQPYLSDGGGYPLSQPWYGAARPGGYGSIMWGSGTWGSGMGYGMGMRFPPTSSYRHEVSLLLRDLRNGQVVYETRAVHFGPWSDTLNILPALLDAALRDFPNPPAGPRKINIEIPR